MSTAEELSRVRACHRCVFAAWDPVRWLRDVGLGWPGSLTCVNSADRPGRLTPVLPNSVCPNFRARREPAVWTVPPEPPNESIRYIGLTKGRYAVVDAADYEWLSKYKWTALVVGDKVYAIRSHKGKTILMHREIMQPAQGMVVDHIDGNGLNNCRGNLRVCTPQQNTFNSRPRPKKSKFKGVRYDAETGKWIAEITHNGIKYHLGTFATEVEAARAYDRKAVELQGPYARLNFPEEWPPPQERARSA
jgi:hypothetical protein